MRNRDHALKAARSRANYDRLDKRHVVNRRGSNKRSQRGFWKTHRQISRLALVNYLGAAGETPPRW